MKSPYRRERLELSDGDFLDLDWVNNESDQLIIISHGFEGNSRDHFILELAGTLKESDLLVWHYRSCGEELNRLARFYYQGDIEDLDAVITYASNKKSYKRIVLLGFSMGGNLVINYLGSELCQNDVRGGVTFSTPMDLKAASSKLKGALSGRVESSFLDKFKKKIIQKADSFPEQFDLKEIDKISSLEELMETYVLPEFGFSSVEDFHHKWSSSQFISKINKPLLIVNTQNDPLLSENCFPYQQCESSEYIHLETPKHGGHMGFTGKKNGQLWYIWRIKKFISDQLSK